MKYDINKFKENKKALEQQHLKLKNLENDNDILKNNISEKYYKLERELKNKQYAEEKKNRDIFDKQKEIIEKNSEELKKIETQFRRIKNLKKLITKCKRLDEYSVYKYDYLKRENGYSDIENGKQKIFYNPIAMLENNEFLQMSLFITENDKPKNKYSLIIVGNSFFNDRFGNSKQLLEHNIYCYGIKAHTDKANIVFGIKDFPTKKSAEEYALKHKDKFLKPYREDHEKLIQEYKDVIENTNTTEWKIAVLEDEKYYYENNYSNGTEEQRYKEVIKELQQLNRSVRK